MREGFFDLASPQGGRLGWSGMQELSHKSVGVGALDDPLLGAPIWLPLGEAVNEVD